MEFSQISFLFIFLWTLLNWLRPSAVESNIAKLLFAYLFLGGLFGGVFGSFIVLAIDKDSVFNWFMGCMGAFYTGLIYQIFYDR